MKRSVSSVLAERRKQRRSVTPTPTKVRHVKFSPEEMAYDPSPEETNNWLPIPGRGLVAIERFVKWKRQMAQLEPDVRKAFPDDKSVNQALRSVLKNSKNGKRRKSA